MKIRTESVDLLNQWFGLHFMAKVTCEHVGRMADKGCQIEKGRTIRRQPPSIGAVRVLDS